jgi:hypothetical protein
MPVAEVRWMRRLLSLTILLASIVLACADGVWPNPC